jgi:DNA-binding NarL/FixJ family response regulator
LEVKTGTTAVVPKAERFASAERGRQGFGRIRVLIADDHAVVRQGLRTLLETEAGYEVCGEATSGRQAIELALRLVPDVTILDISMPGLNGLAATQQIRKSCRKTEILVLTVHDSEQLAESLLCAGALGYVLKSDMPRDLITGVESVCRHRPFFTGRLARTVLSGYLKDLREKKAKSAACPASITSREREIIQLLAEGKSNKEVAALLHVSLKTAETHRTNLMRKLDLHSISDVVHYAVQNQIIQP